MLALLERLLGIALQILGIAQAVRDMMGDVAREQSPYLLQTYTGETRAVITNPTWGNEAIHADLAALAGTVAGIETNVTTLIAAVNLLSAQTGSPFQASDWVPPPPEGPDAGTIAAAVWSEGSPVSQLSGYENMLTRGNLLDMLGADEVLRQAWYGLPIPEHEWYAIVPGWTDVWGPSGWKWGQLLQPWLPAEPDFADWQDGDTPYSFLARTQPAFGWSDTGPSGVAGTSGIAWHQEGSGLSRYYIRSNFTGPSAAVENILTTVENPPPTPVDVDVPPVWTGLGDVTLGAQVALADQTILDGPMDGVVLNITTPPRGTGKYIVGGCTLDYMVGRITFETDRGDAEPWQYLGFRQAIFTPKTMTSATRALFQVLAGAEGTVRTFTRN